MNHPIDSCYQCGLPLPRKPFPGKALGKDVLFCCYGCLLVHEITGEKAEEGEALWIFARLGLSVFFAMNVMMLSYTDYFYPFEKNVASMINYIMLALTTPVMIILGAPILKNSIRGISKLALNMDTLIVLGTFSAYVLSAISTFKAQGRVYFDTASMLLVLVTVGRFLEANAKARTSNAIKELLELSPKEATVIRDGIEEVVPAESLKKGEIIKVIPGENFPVDGEVIDGEGSVDESMLTGESKPVFKEKASLVFAGTANLDGRLIFKATDVGDEMVLSRLCTLLEEARRSRAPIERFADRVSSFFIPSTVIVSVATFIVWNLKSGIDTALMNSLSVLLISCPCALGLATPMAIWVSLGRAAKEGILIRTGETLEKLSSIKRVFFDKTGTLTKGRMELTSVFADSDSRVSEGDLISISASLESNSEHPLGKSLVEFANKRGYTLLPVSDFKASAGMGIQGKVGELGETIYIGSGRFMEKNGLEYTENILKEKTEQESRGKTPVFCGWGKKVNGILGFSEELREEAGDTISNLKDLGVNIYIITGDDKYAGEAISKILGIEVKSELLPEDKVNVIKALKNSSGLTAMVGDGINDAPALASADVGIALGCGVEITRESADVSLLGNDLKKIPWVLQLAKKTQRKIKENLFWAFSYNTIGIGFAVFGTLKPVIAALAMILSSLFVLGNSLRLQKLKINS
ncbi:MAG: heavy metal translocating P-type ATPase [Candidatus Dadabacteria bacterium]|nr:heavy metal translocating P-type ATPase [Candidatus Dadabacteria bacterium]